tara:strand:- start:419 stop:2272 length:1854 start_codon:yes stop_codon:yes gene_type:complete
MARDIKKEVKLTRDLNYLNKDFSGFRKDLLNYAKTHFNDQIKDFSEVSVGGMFVDMAAYVGDVMSFYLDHQFSELSLETAIEDANVERLIRQSGVVITGASPSTVLATVYLKVDAVYNSVLGKYYPDLNQLPILKAGTRVASVDGIIFELTEDYDLSERGTNGEIIAGFKASDIDGNNNPINFIVFMDCSFTSAVTKTETFDIPNIFKPFRTIKLAESDISEIISLSDSENNQYYEVKSLTHDVVYQSFRNTTSDRDLVRDKLGIIPAPRRFVKNFSIQDGKSTIRFGSGRSDTYEDDIIPDPSDHALPLFGNKKTFSKFSLDPNKLLETRSLGVSPMNTTLTVQYRHGGGFEDNIAPGQLTSIVNLSTKFNTSVSASKVRQIRSTFEFYNEQRASGGTDRPTLDDMRSIALSFQGSQDRLVTKQDLIARVYTMPSNFGRVFRAAVSKNNFSQNTAFLALITKNSSGYLIPANDSLKNNISKYLNEYRLIGDSIDMIDAAVVNIGLRFQITVDKRYNENNVLTKVIRKIKNYLKTDNFQINQPINKTNINLLITSTEGVNSLISMTFFSRSGSFQGREYSVVNYNVNTNTIKGVLYPPSNGIFEVKYPDDDIVGKVV